MIAVSQHDLLQVLRHVLTVFSAEIRRLKRGLDAQLPAIPFLLRFVEPQLLCVPVRPVLILGKHIFLHAILGDPRALEQRKNIACLLMLGALPLCLRLPLRIAVIPRLVSHRHHTVVQPERIRQPRKLRRVQIAQMIDRIVVFILNRESADLFCKIRLNCQNAVLKGIFKLISQIFEIRVVAADGRVLELPAAVIELHDPRAVNGFFNVEVVKKDRCLRVLISAHVSTAAGGQTEQPHP